MLVQSKYDSAAFNRSAGDVAAYRADRISTVRVCSTNYCSVRLIMANSARLKTGQWCMWRCSHDYA